MKDFIKILLREALTRKLQYIGQCDTLRKKSNENEIYWQK
jgi:hypothetical protein